MVKTWKSGKPRIGKRSYKGNRSYHRNIGYHSNKGYHGYSGLTDNGDYGIDYMI